MALIINGLRFACEGCIRGHRSANCNHKDRQLKEIKPRGRPLSQCKTCRDNRKNLGKHSKCYCGDDCKEKELDPQVDERSEVGESREGEGKVGEGSASASASGKEQGESSSKPLSEVIDISQQSREDIIEALELLSRPAEGTNPTEGHLLPSMTN